MTVGSPQPFSGYETSDFYYTGFGISQDIPGPGKLGLRAKQAEQEAETAHDAFLMRNSARSPNKFAKPISISFYLRQMLDSLHETQADVDRVAATAEAQYQVAMAQQQDVLKAQLEQTEILTDLEMNQEEFAQGQANLKAIAGARTGFGRHRDR